MFCNNPQGGADFMLLIRPWTIAQMYLSPHNERTVIKRMDALVMIRFKILSNPLNN